MSASFNVLYSVHILRISAVARGCVCACALFLCVFVPMCACVSLMKHVCNGPEATSCFSVVSYRCTDFNMPEILL